MYLQTQKISFLILPIILKRKCVLDEAKHKCALDVGVPD